VRIPKRQIGHGIGRIPREKEKEKEMVQPRRERERESYGNKPRRMACFSEEAVTTKQVTIFLSPTQAIPLCATLSRTAYY